MLAIHPSVIRKRTKTQKSRVPLKSRVATEAEAYQHRQQIPTALVSVNLVFEAYTCRRHVLKTHFTTQETI
jgi:hypothetical protein